LRKSSRQLGDIRRNLPGLTPGAASTKFIRQNWSPTARAVIIQAKAAIIGSAAISTAISIRLRSSPKTRLASSNCRFFFRNKLLRVSGGNLGAPLSWHSGDNLTKVSCHWFSPQNLDANSLGRNLGVLEASTGFFSVIFASLAGLYFRGLFCGR
jgi:hypothetical protein